MGRNDWDYWMISTSEQSCKNYIITFISYHFLAIVRIIMFSSWGFHRQYSTDQEVVSNRHDENCYSHFLETQMYRIHQSGKEIRASLTPFSFHQTEKGFFASCIGVKQTGKQTTAFISTRLAHWLIVLSLPSHQLIVITFFHHVILCLGSVGIIIIIIISYDGSCHYDALAIARRTQNGLRHVP